MTRIHLRLDPSSPQPQNGNPSRVGLVYDLAAGGFSSPPKPQHCRDEGDLTSLRSIPYNFDVINLRTETVANVQPHLE